MREMKTLRNIFFGLIALILLVVAVYSFVLTNDDEREQLILATTTSTYDSGLLDYLLPDFQDEYDVEVRIISVGTGQAIKTAEQGNADIILVHAPIAEKEFVEKGFGVERKCVMYNDFIILGPTEDPSEISGLGVKDALAKIGEQEHEFISRGDDSGTHKKELKLWSETDVHPEGEWYLELGSGMGDTLRLADEKQAYVMADRGTYLSMKDQLDLEILVKGDDILLNPYGIIAVNPEIHPEISYDNAMKMINWIMSDKTQKRIAGFRKNDEELFSPLYGECIV